MSISTSIALDRVSKAVGYALKKGQIVGDSPNLPPRILIIGEANEANQATLQTTKQEILSASQAGNLYGFGSPIYNCVRILKPVNGVGVGSIPVLVIPQEKADGAVAATRTVTVSGTVARNATHTLSINGRTSVDGQSYSYTVLTTDSPTQIAVKIRDAVNSVVGSPVIATSALGVVTLTAKWAGLTSEQINVEALTGGNDVGLTYVVTSTATGAGSPSIASALAQIGNEWTNIIINTYDTQTFDDLEAFNGTPEDETAGGRYSANNWKPLMSVWGSVSASYSTVTTITGASARRSQVTHTLAPAPNSKGFTHEASANLAFLWATTMQNTPHLDVQDKAYPDMPVPSDLNIGDFANQDTRDLFVKNGASTVDIVGGRYVMIDSTTTYRPEGETNPQWRHVRSLVQDWNVKFGLFLIIDRFITGHAVAKDNQVVSASKVIKPKIVKALLITYGLDLASRAIIVDTDFFDESIQVGIGTTNPDRIEMFFRYKRSPFARIVSTTGEANFATGLTA